MKRDAHSLATGFTPTKDDEAHTHNGKLIGDKFPVDANGYGMQVTLSNGRRKTDVWLQTTSTSSAITHLPRYPSVLPAPSSLLTLSTTSSRIS